MILRAYGSGFRRIREHIAEYPTMKTEFKEVPNGLLFSYSYNIQKNSTTPPYYTKEMVEKNASTGTTDLRTDQKFAIKLVNKNLILVGGGGHCKSVIDAAESAEFNILGILDLHENVGQSICGIKIIGTDNKIIDYIHYALFVISVGYINDNSLRLKLYSQVKRAGGKFATVIASTAHVSRHAAIGEGTVVLHQACINAGAKIGKNCIINTNANIEHDVQIGNHTHISTGAMINGGCVIGESVFIGSQSTTKQGIHISDNVSIGASSFVNKNICESGIYVGIPARKIVEKIEKNSYHSRGRSKS